MLKEATLVIDTCMVRNLGENYLAVRKYTKSEERRRAFIMKNVL